MECLPVGKLPEGDVWVYQLKFDGYRAQAIRDQSGARLLSRSGKDFNRKYPMVVAALKDALPPGTALDGELVAFDKAGSPSFKELQDSNARTNVVFFVFDLLATGGPCHEENPALITEVMGSGDRVAWLCLLVSCPWVSRVGTVLHSLRGKGTRSEGEQEIARASRGERWRAVSKGKSTARRLALLLSRLL